VIAADEVVAAAKETITLCESSRTVGVINSHIIPTADFILNRDFDFQSRKVNHVLETALRKESSSRLANFCRGCAQGIFRSTAALIAGLE